MAAAGTMANRSCSSFVTTSIIAACKTFFPCHPAFIASSSCTLHSSPIALSQPLNSVPFHLPRARRRADEGSWRFSPEWWGTQGRGWGHNEGVTVFTEASDQGNGLVSVTAHPASTPGPEDWPAVKKELKQRQARYGSSGECWDMEILGYEWRVLRFNDVTRQSVAKVLVVQKNSESEEVFLLQKPDCLAFEYLKSGVSVGLASVSYAGLDLELVARGKQRMRILCVGLGGGSLPLFLAEKLQGCFVEVVEIDRTVISAATEFMGFPSRVFGTSTQAIMNSSSRMLNYSGKHPYSYHGARTPVELRSSWAGAKNDSLEMGFWWGGITERIFGFEADGVAYVCGLLQKVGKMETSSQYYDLVFVDAFDGKDEVPYGLWSRDGPFLRALCSLLHPLHGTVVVNLHTDMPPPSLLERMTGDFGPSFDPLLPGGKQVQQISRAYRDVLLLPYTEENDTLHSSSIVDNSMNTGAAGVAFTVATPSQQNISLVVSRGIQWTKKSIVDNLKVKASHVEGMLNSPFDMSQRVSRRFNLVN